MTYEECKECEERGEEVYYHGEKAYIIKSLESNYFQIEIEKPYTYNEFTWVTSHELERR